MSSLFANTPVAGHRRAAGEFRRGRARVIPARRGLASLGVGSGNRVALYPPTGKVEKFKLREMGVTGETWDLKKSSFEVMR